MGFLKQVVQSFFNIVKRICGERRFIFEVLGVPLVTVTERDPHHFNVFILFLPLLQIVTGPKAHMVNLLLLVWALKCIKYLFTGWSFVRQPEIARFAFCGKTIYEERLIEPYKFPSTTFRDKQVDR